MVKMMNLAKDCLDKARFFAENARAAETRDQTQFRLFLETAIVWSRSVTLLLQKQYSKIPGFADWYANQQDELQADPLARFFLHQRNFVLKQKSLPLGKGVNVHPPPVSITVEVPVPTVRVIRGSWRSRLRHLLQDFLTVIRQRMEKIRTRLRHRKRKQEPTKGVITEYFHFTEQPWDTEPAIDLLDRHLEHLQRLVNSATEQFGERE